MSPATRYPSHSTEVPASLPSFVLPVSSKSYAQQYANLYYLRLIQLRPSLLNAASKLWKDLPSKPKLVNKVLDVQGGRLCWIVGTVYMDMNMKPNILADLAREHYIAAPPPRRKFFSDADEVMLEDESGRVRLIGERIANGAGAFVTGTIMAVLGAETPAGDFEVAELCYAGLPPQPALSTPKTSDDRMEEENEGEWVAIVSGLEMGSNNDPNDLRAQLLLEWLVGELGDDEDQQQSLKITKLILAGNSLSQPVIIPMSAQTSVADSKKTKRYGYDSSLYSSEPTAALDAFLTSVLETLDVDVLPGESDPTGPTMPQQSLHKGLFPRATSMGVKPTKLTKASGIAGKKALSLVTNPSWSGVGNATFFGHSGQPLDDIFKYLATEDRLMIAEQTLEWAHVAPTCPDTLWCYPFSTHDPFILATLPSVYFIGNQLAYATSLVESEGKKCRIVLVPKFSEQGEVVCVRVSDGAVKVIKFGSY